MNILFGIPLWVGCLITAMDTFTFMLIHWYGVRKLEFLFVSLVGIMAICFGIELFIALPPAGPVFKGWALPYCTSNHVEQAVGMLGAVIMPHNLFLHSALVQTRSVQRTKKKAVREANFYFTIESAISLLVSFFINLCVVAVFAHV